MMNLVECAREWGYLIRDLEIFRGLSHWDRSCYQLRFLNGRHVTHEDMDWEGSKTCKWLDLESVVSAVCHFRGLWAVVGLGCELELVVVYGGDELVVRVGCLHV